MIKKNIYRIKKKKIKEKERLKHVFKTSIKPWVTSF